MALSIDLTGLTDVQWRAIYEFLNRYLVPNIVKEPGGPRGQIFRAYLEQINLVATGQLSIEDFLWNIGDIFPVAGEDNNRFRELAEQAQYNGFLKEFEETYGEIAYVALSMKDYENLALNIADIRRYLEQQNEIIVYYEKAVTNDTESEEKK